MTYIVHSPDLLKTSTGCNLAALLHKLGAVEYDRVECGDTAIVYTEPAQLELFDACDVDQSELGRLF